MKLTNGHAANMECPDNCERIPSMDCKTKYERNQLKTQYPDVIPWIWILWEKHAN